MLLSIIIVSYNTRDLTIQTIKSAIKDINGSKLLKNQTEIVVVDNNSIDNSVKAVRLLKQKTKIPLRIIPKKENLGFGKANNIGIEKTTGEYVLLLNSDTIVRKNALETMVSRFLNDKQKNSNNKIGIVAATLLNTDLSLQPQGGCLPSLLNLFFHMSMVDDLPIIGKFIPSVQDTGINSWQLEKYSFDKKGSNTSDKLIDIGWVGGTAMMIPRASLDEFGLLDPNIFMYSEDVELCFRARNHHYRVVIDPQAQIIHLKNQSSSSKNAIRGEFNGYLYIFSKHFSRTQLELAKIILQIGAILRIILFSYIFKNKFKKEIYSTVLKDLNS